MTSYATVTLIQDGEFVKVFIENPSVQGNLLWIMGSDQFDAPIIKIINMISPSFVSVEFHDEM